MIPEQFDLDREPETDWQAEIDRWMRDYFKHDARPRPTKEVWIGGDFIIVDDMEPPDEKETR